MNLIFDIGANHGLFTDKCLSEYPYCKIILVEANSSLVEKLTRKYKDKNVIVLERLVSNVDDEELEFWISPNDTISTASTDWITNSRFRDSGNWYKPEIKKTITIETLISKYGNPNLIKIDVEGYEFEVISGLCSKQEMICFEWTEEEYIKLNDTASHLRNLGYEKFGFTYGDDYLLLPTKFSDWNELDLHKDINLSRKSKWGMIWVK